MREIPITLFAPPAERSPLRARRIARAKAASLRKADLAMLPLYALAVAGAAAFTSQWASGLGAWPLLTVLACPLLHLVMRGE